MTKTKPAAGTLDDSQLEDLRRRNLGRLLDEVHVGFDRLALSYLREEGFPDITSAAEHVLRTMRTEGATLTSMAEQAGISKQAMSKLVAVFEKGGYVEWRSVEGGNTRLVHATQSGRDLLETGLRAVKRAEEVYFAALTSEEQETLRELLLRAAVSHEGSPERDSIWRRRRA
ncbi:MarR family winged helix-turn-helix transcriptional regulator [Amorphus sp. 3PC139-8]|uniref:MarR family winged helix-turn-helix transcriptional regulator n=1 Tax=Amorphus sp. 3PC139-8 TaxID=2735676 RepID=UPI00345C9D94